MKDLLKRLKLILDFETKIPISKSLFIQRLSNITEKSNIGVTSDFLSLFNSSKKEFIGTITEEGFKIKRRKRFIDTNVNIAFAQGTFNEQKDNLEIKGEVYGFNKFFIIWYIAITTVFVGMLASLIIFKPKTETVLFITLTLQAIFAYLLPFYIMRKGAKRLSYELERDFYYLTKTENDCS